MRRKYLVMALLPWAMAAQAQEENASRTDTEPQLSAVSPEIPDITPPDGKFGSEAKYFVFHKAGVSYQEALADFTECNRHVAHGVWRDAPSFVPWGQDDKGRPLTPSYESGLLGAVMWSMISGGLDRSVRQTIMIRCMMPKGYLRYRMGEQQFRDLFEKRKDALELAAAIASGPTPPTPRAFP